MSEETSAIAAGTRDASARPGAGRRPPWMRRLVSAAIVLAVLFAAIQLVPFGHSANPPVTRAAVWPDPKAQTLAEGACYDCHSNLTKRWWATEIAPASWLAQSDENGGRSALDFSEWDRSQAALDRVVEAVRSGSMPPLQYKLFHGNARLTSAERQRLVDGLQRLYATDPPMVADRRSG